MGSFSIWHILLLAVIILVLFGGRGKISDVMGDFARGIKSFKKGLSEEETTQRAVPEQRDDASTTQKDTTARS